VAKLAVRMYGFSRFSGNYVSFLFLGMFIASKITSHTIEMRLNTRWYSHFKESNNLLNVP
jgi:hypothetical protein